MPERRIHDYTRRGWGHDYTITPDPDPVTARVTGWGYGLREGDFLLIAHSAGGTCVYEIETIRRPGDPPDMWFTTCRFVPGSSQLGAQIGRATCGDRVFESYGAGPWWVLHD